MVTLYGHCCVSFVLAVPSRPQSANVTKVLPTVVELDIQQPEEDGGMPVTHYIVNYEDESVEFVLGMCVSFRNYISVYCDFC